MQVLAMDETCKITLSAINNILLQDKLCHRTLSRECRRKRSYSCSDDTQVNLPKHKKSRTAEDQDVSGPSSQGKRAREPEHDDDDIAHWKRRKENDGPSLGRATLVPNPVPRQQQGTRDDEGVRYRVSGSEKLEALKHYLSGLPPSMWTAYGSSLIDRAIRKVRFEHVDDKFLGKIIEHIFSEKLLSFSTVSVENYSTGLEATLFDKLIKCIRLVVLEVTVVPQGETDVVAASIALQRLSHLRSLSLLPSCRYSYHWAVSHVARHCQALRELKIVYDGDLFDSVNELTRLQNCSKMTSLWLFNFGRKTETKVLTQLMNSLEKLKVLFHKELPNAIMALHGARSTGEQALEQRVERQLALERVDLCWYQRAVGYQLVYVPSSYLLQVAKVCPQIRVLNLVSPPCLAKVVKNLPQLRVLVLQQASLTSCLACTLNNLGLSRVTEIRATDVCDVTHDIISALARGCPHLQVLNIINSSLKARGDLQTPTHRHPFPCLRQLTLVPVMIHGRPSLTNPSIWQLGAQLTSYLLGGASQLTAIHLHYKPEDIIDGDLPTAHFLEAVFICHRPALRSLLLEWPPAVSPGLVGAVVRACPALTTLASILTWPLTSHQRAAIVTRHGRHIDIT